MLKKLLLLLILLNHGWFVLQADEPKKEEAPASGSDQQMVDFSLAGYNQKGQKSWEVKGNSADIFTDTVQLSSVKANVYNEQEKINLVADKGEYDKNSGKMNLKDNVVVTTETGGKLTTDSLAWDRASQKVTTDDPVNVVKENIIVDGKGMEGRPDLQRVSLKDDIQVQITENTPSTGPLKAAKEPTIITCTGPLEIDYGREIAIFNNNVKVDQSGDGAEKTEMYADKMEVYFDFKNKQILNLKSIGNVKIVKGDNISYSDEANYIASEKKMTLTGRPRLLIYSEEKLVNAPSGS